MAGKEKAPGVIAPRLLRDATFICHTLVTAAEEAVNVEAPAEKTAKPRRWRADKGCVYENPQSACLWLDYRTPSGKRVRESSGVKVAPKKLREAIQKAKDILAQRFESIGLGVDSTIGRGCAMRTFGKTCWIATRLEDSGASNTSSTKKPGKNSRPFGA